MVETSQTESPYFAAFGQARQALLNLPGVGVEKYVPDPAGSFEDVERGLEKMTTELLHDLDSQNMVASITYQMGWADDQKERKDFFKGEREPFQSKLKFSSDPAERKQEFLTIGSYLSLKYQATQEAYKVLEATDADLAAAKDNLSMFCDYSTQNLFKDASYDFWDEVYGIDPVKRRQEGALKESTNEMIDLIAEETQRVAGIHKKDPLALLGDVFEATDNGNFSRIFTFLVNNRGTPEIREVLEAVYEKRMSNEDLTVKQLQLLWKVETYRRTLGIDLDTYYEIGRIPAGPVVTDRLHKFLTDKESLQELEKHVKEEAPSFNTKRFFDLLTARAIHLGLPEQLSSGVEADEKVVRVEENVIKLFPPAKLALQAGERFVTNFPDGFGASVSRPANVSYYNKDAKLVTVNILSRYDEENRVTGRDGHEKTHATHLSATIAADVIEHPDEATKDSYFRTSGVVREALAKMVESQILKILKLQQGKDITEYKIWGDLMDAIIDRRQRPFGLTQMAVRRRMEDLSRGGFREEDLPEDKAREIISDITPQLKIWASEGYPMEDPRATVLNNINIINGKDGLVYGAGRDDLQFAFETRFGNMWLTKKDARAVLLDVMIKTRDTSDMALLGNYVFKAAGTPEDIKEVYERLKSWGISEEYI